MFSALSGWFLHLYIPEHLIGGEATHRLVWYPPPSQGEGIQTGIWRVSKPPSQLASELLVQASQAAAEIAELSCSIMDPAKR